MSFLFSFIFFFFNISAASASERSGVSKSDDKRGYQIQVLYVETASSKGSNYDLNGKINEWVAQIQTWLQAQVGKKLIFDTVNGELDIAYLKFDGNLQKDTDEIEQIVATYRKLNPKTYFGKTLAVVVDQTVLPGVGLCGWAGRPSDYSIFMPNLTYPDGGGCSNLSHLIPINNGFTYEAQAILHELIHSYGVDHVCVDNTDLMQGSPECEELGVKSDDTKPVTFDATKSNYFGGSAAGIDISKLGIWEGETGNKRPDLGQNMCWKGESCKLSSTTFSENGIVELQIKTKNGWKAVHSSKGTVTNCKGCYKYLFENVYTFNKPGKFTYRIYKLETKKYRAYAGSPRTIRVID